MTGRRLGVGAVVVVLAASTACTNAERTEAPADAARRLITLPPETVELGIMSLGDGDRAVVSARDEKSGDFGLWKLDLATDTWRPFSRKRYGYVAALGLAPSGDVLFSDARPGLTIATLVRPRGPAVETVLGRGIPRAAVFDAVTASWLVAGAFKGRPEPALVLRLSDGRFVTTAMRAPTTLRFDLSPADHIGVALQDDRVLVTAPTSCHVLEATTSDPTPRPLIDLRALDPTFRLLGDYAGPSGESVDQRTAAVLAYDCPIRLWSLDADLVVLIRRANQAGWTLIRCRRDGSVVGRAELPWSMVPDALNAKWVVTEQQDVDRPGEPAHLSVHRLAELFSQGGARAVNAAEPPLELVYGEAWPDSVGRTTAPRVVAVDAAACVGDIHEEITRARHARKLDGRCSLVVINAKTEGFARAIASSLRADLDFGDVAWACRGGAPAAFVPFERTVRLAPAAGVP